MAKQAKKVVLDGEPIGRNVATRIEGRKLIIEVDMDGAGTISKSGKNTVVASTGGNQAINDIAKGRVGKLGLNFYFPVA